MSKRLFKFIKIFSQIADDVFNLKIIKKNTNFLKILLFLEYLGGIKTIMLILLYFLD